MADHSLIDKANTCDRVATQLEGSSQQLYKLDSQIDNTIVAQLFPTIEGHTAEKLHEMYGGWEGDLARAGGKTNYAAQLLREKAHALRHEYDRQVQEDHDREEREKKEKEQKEKDHGDGGQGYSGGGGGTGSW